MASQTLDLVHELQVELGWQPDFAQAAHVEYMRWLRLRSQSGDFQNCKLPPSRVVAMVWSQHRQWTLDYENTCASLGGFIHHFPPAMRMNIAREQAYAATIHTYKTFFKQDPPPSYWGPAICSYKPLSSDSPALAPPTRALPSLRRSPTKRDSSLRAPAASSKHKSKHAEPPSRRNSAPLVASASTALPVERSRTTTEDPRTSRRAKSLKELKLPIIPAVADHLEKQDPTSANKTRRKFPGSSSLYALKPLRPGEKRKRGRPSFSDYLVASSAPDGTPALKKKHSKPLSPSENILSPKSPPANHILRRRKSLASPVKHLPATPIIAKKDKAKTPRRFSRPPTATPTTVTAPSPAGKTSTKEPPSTVHKSPIVKDPKDPAGIIKRPRGRPRKDGSWPVARGRKTDAASKPAASVAPKPAPVAAARAEHAKSRDDKLKVKAKTTKPDASENAPLATSPPLPPISKLPPSAAASVTGLTATPVTNTAGAKKVTTAVSVPPPVVSSGKEVSMDGNSKGGKSDPSPSKAIDTVDIRLQVMADKDMPKMAAVVEHIPRQGEVFDTVIDGSGLADKDRHAENTIPLIPKDVRMGQDVVFPQTETIPNPVDMDMPLGAPSSRPTDAIPSVAATIAPASGPGQSSRPEKFMSHVNAFPMTGMTVNPVTNSMDGGMLAMGPPGTGPKKNAGPDKDGDSRMDADPKKPFKRPRGRPRKESTWPAPRPKPMGDDSVAGVKELNDTTQLSFPMGPSGTV